MSVKNSVNACGVKNYICGSPGSAIVLGSKVSKCEYVLCAFSSGCVNSALHCFIQLLSVLILAERINVLTRIIHEILGCGRCNGLGSADADKSNLHAAYFFDLISVKNGLAVLVHEVTGYVRELSLTRKLEESLHSVIELVVTGNRYVESRFVHNVNDSFAL